MSINKKRAIRKIGIALFVCYLLVLVYFLFFSENYGRVVEEGRSFRYNVFPFQEIHRFLAYSGQIGGFAVLVNVLGNILAFVPLGFFIPAIFPKIRSGFPAALMGFLISLLVELIQLITRVGIFDVDDLILNTLGAAIGYFILLIVQKIRRRNFCG